MFGEHPTPIPVPTPPEPDAPPVAVAAVGSDLPFEPVVHRIPLDAEAGSPWAEVQLRSETFLLPTADGGAWLTWNQGKYASVDWVPRQFRRTRLMRLGPDLRPLGPSVAGPEEMAISAAHAMPDGGLVALAQREKRLDGIWLGHEAWYLRFDASGAEVARHLMLGTGDRGPGEEYFHFPHGDIAVSGDRVAIYFESAKNFARPGEAEDIHMGDTFVVFGPDDKPIPELGRSWLSSHSNLMRVVPGTAPGTFWGVTVGDGAPLGLQFMTSHGEGTPLIWRPRGDYTESATGAGGLGGMERLGDLAYALLSGSDLTMPPTVGTREVRAPLLLGVDGTGQVRRKRWLDGARPNTDQVSCAPLGADQLLIGWGSWFYPQQAGEADPDDVTPIPRFAIYDPARDAVTLGPRELDVPFSARATWARLADGSVAWAVVQEPNLMEAAIVRVRPR